MAAAIDKVDSGGTDEAEEERRRRLFMRALAPLLVTILGFLYGFSPLVTPIAEHFAGDEGSADGIEGGLFLYGFAILFFGLDLLGSLCVVLFEGRPILRRYVIDGTVLLFPVSLACLTLSVHLHSVPLLLGSFGVMSVPMATVGQYLLHADMPRFWRGRTNVGSAICGFSIGVGGFSWMLCLGELINVLGHDKITTVLAVCTGASAVLCALVVLLYKPGAINPPSKGSTAGSTSSAHRSFGELFRDWRLHVFIFAINGFIFCGMSMKMLLSTLFEKVLNLEFVDATRMSAFCLFAYIPGRGLAPLFASQDRVFTLFIVVVGLECAAYALTPWAVSLATNSGTKAVAMIVYTALRLVSGGGFAVLLGNLSVLGVRIFGPDDFSLVVMYWGLSEWIVGAGPSIAWFLHVQAIENEHVDPQKSFNRFFFLCSALAACVTVCVALLAWDQRVTHKSMATASEREDKDTHCANKSAEATVGELVI